MKQATLNVPLPADKMGFRIRHLHALDHRMAAPATLSVMVDIIASVSGLSKVKIRTCYAADIIRMFAHLQEKFFQIDAVSHPPKEIELEGKIYTLINPTKGPAAWVLDASVTDFEKDPVLMAAMSYVPKGIVYGAIDQHDNVIYDPYEHRQTFSEHFPLETYIQLSAFFLRSYVASFKRRQAAAKKANLPTIKSQITKKYSAIGWKLFTLYQNITALLGIKSRK